MDRTKQWQEYLENTRKISRSVLVSAKIKLEENRLVIPVRDINGKTLFNKYRKAPWDTSDKPKYMYDTGSKSSLFGLHSLNLADDYVYVVEGEIDALTMHTIGHPAVSTTGGAGTWNKEWNKYLEGRQIFICYDADGPGARGAIRVALKIERPTTICVLDPFFGTDINEQWSTHDALAYEPVQIAYEEKSDLPFVISAIRELRRKSFGEDDTKLYEQYDVMLEHLKGELPMKIKRRKTHVSGSMEQKKESARAYPIRNIIKVDNQGFAVCPFHKEKTPSMKVYKDNHAYCFGQCAKRFDAIDIYMHIKNCDFKQAINDLQ